MQRSVWRHFAVLVFLALLIPVAQYASLFRDRVPTAAWGAILWAALLESPRQWYYLLPLAPAIAAAVAYVGRTAVGNALRMVGVTLLLMLAIDIWIAPAADGELARLAAHPPAQWPDTRSSAGPPNSLFEDVGAIRAAVTLVREHPAALHEQLREYPATHPRVVAERAVEDVTVLLVPVILVGILIGVSAWVERRVLFRSARDALVARWSLAWVIAPAAWAVIGTWSRGAGTDVLFRNGSLWLPLVPYLPFAVLGVLGWRAALRQRESDHAAWANPDSAPLAPPSRTTT